MTRIAAAFRAWAEMVKLSHSVFALPFALIAAFLAGREIPRRGWPYPGHLLLVVMAMVSARSVAMTFNRIVDAGIDSRNPRTAGRHLPTGRLSMTAAWSLWGLSALTFGIACMGFFVLYKNAWPILLSGPVLVYICGYTFTKRFTRWSHVYLGSAIALAPPAAWLAVHPPSVGWTALLLVAAVTCWIAGFDIIYACQDIEVDRKEGLYSLPASLGPRSALLIAKVLHAACVAALVTVGISANLGAVYAIGVAIAAALLIVENALVRPHHYEHVNLAFFTMNGLVSLVLAAAAITDVVRFRLAAPM